MHRLLRTTALLGSAFTVLAGGVILPATASAESVACAPSSATNNCVEITYTGAAQTFVVPAGVTRLEAVVVGAGGGGSRFASAVHHGGNGGRTTGTLAVTPREALTITVGGGGVTGFGGFRGSYGGGGASGVAGAVGGVYGSAGGGMSAVWAGPKSDPAAALLVAGGGGGGAGRSQVDGGDGGGAAGRPGTAADADTPGQGGTQIAGGTAGGSRPACTTQPQAGTQFFGGTGGRRGNGNGGGGGGGGWFGGGGGGCAQLNPPRGGSGGGGGSGYIASTRVSNGTTTVGDGAAGGASSGSGAASGTNGSVRIEYSTPAPVIQRPAGQTLTNDPRTTIGGTSSPGTTVTLRQGGAAIACVEGDLVVPASGEWTCTPTEDLPDGPANLVASAVDEAVPMASYPDSTPVSITIDTSAPVPPRITAPADGAPGNNATPMFSGTGEDGAVLELRNSDGNVLCSTTVVDGRWNCTLTGPLPDGTNVITPVASDAAGNSAVGNTIRLIVDTTAPRPAERPVCTANADRTVTCSGDAEPGATVIVTTPGGVEICRATVGSGLWSCTSREPVDASDAVVTVVDAAANESPARQIQIVPFVNPTATLAYTGAHVGSIGVLALALLAAGATLLVMRSRSRCAG